MAASDNTIHDLISKATDGYRTATPYELKTLSNAPISTLANLKDTYSKLDPNSIVDYLTSVGQDPSMTNRQTLGAKYGILNIGTKEGNTALLNAMKSGKDPASNTAPVGGSIMTPATSTDSNGITPQTDPNNASAITSDTPTPTTSPDSVTLAKKTYDEAYQAQQTAQKAVADIDATLAQVKTDKMAEIARSGGVVNEASLQSEILRENEPLIARRKQLATEYTQANSNYQKANADYKSTQAEADKAKTLALNQEKVDNQSSQFATKTDIQQQQFDAKLASSNIVKKAVYSDGTKVGETFVDKTTGHTVNVNSQTGEKIGSGTSVGSAGNNVASSTNGKVTYTDFAKVPDAPTPDNINTEYPGTSGKTYGAVYEDAVSYAETGKYQKMGMSSKPSTKAYDNAVKVKAANIAASVGMTEDQLKIAYKSNGVAISKLITMKSTIGAFENRAKSQIDIILNGYTDPRTGKQIASLNSSVPRTDFPAVNGLFVKGKILAGDTNAQLLSNSLITFTAEYAKIMSGGTGSSSASSDSARTEAQQLISTALSQGTLEATLGLLQKELDTTTAGYDKQIKDTSSNMAITGNAGNVSKGSQDVKTFVESSLQRQGYNYDTLMKDMSVKIPTGTQPALDNDTGLPVYATQDEINSGKYTAL